MDPDPDDPALLAAIDHFDAESRAEAKSRTRPSKARKATKKAPATKARAKKTTKKTAPAKRVPAKKARTTKPVRKTTKTRSSATPTSRRRPAMATRSTTTKTADQRLAAAKKAKTTKVPQLHRDAGEFRAAMTMADDDNIRTSLLEGVEDELKPYLKEYFGDDGKLNPSWAADAATGMPLTTTTTTAGLPAGGVVAIGGTHRIHQDPTGNSLIIWVKQGETWENSGATIPSKGEWDARLNKTKPEKGKTLSASEKIDKAAESFRSGGSTGSSWLDRLRG